MNRLRSYFLAIKPNIAASSLLAVSLLIGIVVKSIGWLAGQILSKDLLAVMVLAIPLLFLAYKLRQQSKIAIALYALLAFYMPFYLTDAPMPNAYAVIDYWQSMILNAIGAVWALIMLFKPKHHASY